jgi:hypothetical protein
MCARAWDGSSSERLPKAAAPMQMGLPGFRLLIIKTLSRPEVNNFRRLLNETLCHVTAPRMCCTCGQALC